MTVTPDAIAGIFREEHGRTVSVLIRVLGDIDLAEDAVQDAFAVAVDRWPRDGMPPSPAGWIITTPRRRPARTDDSGALVLLEGLVGDLGTFSAWHVARAELLRRLDRADDARVAYERAIALTENVPERDHLRGRLSSLPR